MRVFVLTPGRTGSTTLFRAFKHSTRFSVGQQSNWGKLGKSRLEYPENHIESDARNIFFMDLIAERYDPKTTHWIVMHRDLGEVTRSYSVRRSKAGIIYNFGVGIVGLKEFSSDSDWMETSKLFVESSYAQIRSFSEGRPNVHFIDLSDPVPMFSRIWQILEAGEGLEAACDEWLVKHNRSARQSSRIKKSAGRIFAQRRREH